MKLWKYWYNLTAMREKFNSWSSCKNEFEKILFKFSVSPGNVWTPLWDQLARSSGNFEKSKKDGDEAQVTQTDFFLDLF